MQSSVSLLREVEATTLPNGLRIVSEYMPHVRSVSVGIWIASGSRHEALEENGIAHFIEHMLFKGTKNRSAEEIAREVDSSGGHLDAWTAKELVSYNTKVLADNLPQAFDVLADLVLNPLLREEDVEKEKGVILEELKMEVDNPEYLVHEMFSSGYYKTHPLGRSILGTKQSVKSFTPQMLRSFYERHYVPANLIITAAGRIQHRCVVELVERYFRSLLVGSALPQVTAPKNHPALALKNKRSLEQAHLVLGVPTYSLQHPGRFGAYVLSTVLGGGMSSRLFQNVREKRGLAYSVFSELTLYRDSGLLSVYAGTSVETAQQVIELTMQEFRCLKDKLVTDEELRRAKDHLKGSIALGLESTSSRMSNLARQAMYYDRFLSIDEVVELIEQVTAEQIRDVAQECLQSDRIALAFLGNLGEMTLSREALVC